MAEGGQITYSDLVKPTESITEAIAQLTKLDELYAGMIDKIKKDAGTIEQSIKSISGANKEQRETIKNAATDTDKLSKAEQKLKESRSNMGVELAKLKQTQQEQNRLTKLELQLNKSKEGSYNKLSAQYSINKIRLNQMSEAQRTGTESGRKLETQTKKIYEEMNRMQKATGKSQLQVGQYERGIQGLAGGMGKLLGAFGVVGGVRMFTKALSDGLRVAKEYEATNAELGAILGTTSSALKNSSLELGRTTAFTATQVTELQIELARLGKSEKEIVDSTEGIINATLALGGSTADTASLVASTLNAFKKSAKESGKVGDILTLSTQKTALSFEKLQTALPTVSGAAAAAGVSLEELVAQLGQASDRGIDASTSATSLRNIYMELAKTGMTYDEAMNEIEKSQDKLSTAVQLFGKRAAVTALSLSDNRNKAQELASALGNAGGTAENVATQKLKTLDGSLKLLSSAWEGFILNVFKSDGSIMGLVKSIVDLTATMLGLVNMLFDSSRAYTEVETAIKSVNENYDKEVDLLEEGNKARDILIDALLKEGLSYSEAEKEADIYLKTLEAINSGLWDKAALELQINMLEVQVAMLEATGGAADVLIAKKEELRNLTDQLEFSQVKLNKATDEELQDYLKMEKNIFLMTDAKKKFIAEVKKEIEARKELDGIDEEKKIKSLIEDQEALLKQAQLMPEATEAQIAQKNRRIMFINEEIKRLKALGKTREEVELIKTPKLGGAEVDVPKMAKVDVPEESFYSSQFVISDETKQGMMSSSQFAIDQIRSVLQAQVEAADEMVYHADREVEANQRRLDAELEARNAGYASNVSMAQKELTLAKKNQDRALKEQAKAQKAQAAIDSLQQVSSLITASANIWSTMGFPWAIPAIALMFGSFAFAKIKAKQVSSQATEEYGDGTVELLSGGSHASGNDIDLGRKKDGTRRRAEGGEYFAVLNKKSSRKYKTAFPEIMKSLNKGVFEEKYLNAYDMGGMSMSLFGGGADLKNLEKDVGEIKKQGERKYMVDGQGRMVEIYKNLRRIHNAN